MRKEEVDKVVELVRENPKDEFWADYGNPDLFRDVIEMVNDGGYDLRLVELDEDPSDFRALPPETVEE